MLGGVTRMTSKVSLHSSVNCKFIPCPVSLVVILFEARFFPFFYT